MECAARLVSYVPSVDSLFFLGLPDSPNQSNYIKTWTVVQSTPSDKSIHAEKKMPTCELEWICVQHDGSTFSNQTRSPDG